MYPNQIHKAWIDDFWSAFGGNKCLGYGHGYHKKLKQIKRMSEVTIEYKHQIDRSHRRKVFDCVKFNRHSLKSHPKCFMCLRDADVRHHLILLKNGGINSKRNLVSLCHTCHAEIHPWLRAKL